MQRLLTFCQQKISMFLLYFKIKKLTSHQLTMLTFEQLGPSGQMDLFILDTPGSSSHIF